MKLTRKLRKHWPTWSITLVTLGIIGGTMHHGYANRFEAPSLPIIEPANNFSLINEEGTAVNLRSSDGQVRLLTFIYTQCTTTCPVITGEMVQIQNALKKFGQFGTQVHFVSITIDPSHDKSSTLHAYAKEAGADLQGWDFLTGSQEQVKTVLSKYGVFAQNVLGNQMVHTSVELLIDQNGNVRKTYGADLSTDQTVQDIQSLLSDKRA